MPLYLPCKAEARVTNTAPIRVAKDEVRCLEVGKKCDRCGQEDPYLKDMEDGEMADENFKLDEEYRQKIQRELDFRDKLLEGMRQGVEKMAKDIAEDAKKPAITHDPDDYRSK